MSDLVQRLKWHSRTYHQPLRGDFLEAADRIEQLERRVAELDGATDAAIEQINSLTEDYAQLEAQNKVLREALQLAENALIQWNTNRHNCGVPASPLAVEALAAIAALSAADKGEKNG
jgi:regulator of replication initiation timing